MAVRPFLIAAAFLTLPARAAEVQVAVASNFTAPMQQLAAQFAQQTGHTAKLSFGATGKFYAQIVNGAPFEVFLSADDDTPARLAREGKAVESTRFTYAVGRLALWSAAPAWVTGPDALKRSDLAHLAIANPRTAPYGAAAFETLKALGLHDAVQGRFVYGENITQAYQFAATGNAQAGFVALSQIQENGRTKSGSAWIVPAHLHGPIRQDAVLLTRGHANPAATALLRYLKSDAARATIRAYGYDL